MVLEKVVKPEIFVLLLISTRDVLNVAIPVKIGSAEPLPQLKVPFPSLVRTLLAPP